MKEDFGTIKYNGLIYALLRQACPTGRSFTRCFSDVEVGEVYTDEWHAPATGPDGKLYWVTWQWDTVKGQEPEDGGDYPWYDSNIVSVKID